MFVCTYMRRGHQGMRPWVWIILARVLGPRAEDVGLLECVECVGWARRPVGCSMVRSKQSGKRGTSPHRL